MNTGKGKISNCKIDFESDSMNSGGTVFVGDIAAGESKSANLNLRISADKLGNATGTIKFTAKTSLAKALKRRRKSALQLRKSHRKPTQAKRKRKKRKTRFGGCLLFAAQLREDFAAGEFQRQSEQESSAKRMN